MVTSLPSFFVLFFSQFEIFLKKKKKRHRSPILDYRYHHCSSHPAVAHIVIIITEHAIISLSYIIEPDNMCQGVGYFSIPTKPLHCGAEIKKVWERPEKTYREVQPETTEKSVFSNFIACRV